MSEALQVIAGHLRDGETIELANRSDRLRMRVDQVDNECGRSFDAVREIMLVGRYAPDCIGDVLEIEWEDCRDALSLKRDGRLASETQRRLQ